MRWRWRAQEALRYHTASVPNDLRRAGRTPDVAAHSGCIVLALAMLAGCQSMSVIASVGSAVGCPGAPTFLGPYRPDVHQGNIITKEMVDQLRIGMTREQVRFMLGTPLMSSEFRKDRVDYIYYLNPLKGPVQNRRLTLYFKDNRLDTFNADPMPGEDEADALILGTERQARGTPSRISPRFRCRKSRRRLRAPPQLTCPNARTVIPMKLAIAGASGRMGQMLIEAALAQPDFAIAVALDRADSPMLGRDCAETMGRSTGVRVTSDLSATGRRRRTDRLHPARGDAASPRSLRRDQGVKMVIGTTGFDEAGKRAIEAAAQRIAIVFAPNMSVGVNATFKLIELAARMLGDGYDIEIIEAHHRHKVDAPSGTALKMGEVVAIGARPPARRTRRLCARRSHRRAPSGLDRLRDDPRRRHRR